jgi:hypothetical protein
MQWLDGDGPPQRAGRHRLRLVWNDLHTDPRASERRLFFQIRQRKDGEDYRVPIREFRIPLSSVNMTPHSVAAGSATLP